MTQLSLVASATTGPTGARRERAGVTRIGAPLL